MFPYYAAISLILLWLLGLTLAHTFHGYIHLLVVMAVLLLLVRTVSRKENR
jgi:hypothetical protein